MSNRFQRIPIALTVVVALCSMLVAWRPGSRRRVARPTTALAGKAAVVLAGLWMLSPIELVPELLPDRRAG